MVTEGTALTGRYDGGLGITSHWFDQHFVDGATRDELLLFRFTADVRLFSATFSFVDHHDSVEFWFDGDHDNSLDGDYAGTFDIPGWPYTLVLAGDHVGRLFGIGASGLLDQFKVRSVTVAAIEAVPLPAALPLLVTALAGVGGAAGWRTRRRLSGS